MTTINDFGVPIAGTGEGVLWPLRRPNIHAIIAAPQLTQDEFLFLHGEVTKFEVIERGVIITFCRSFRLPSELNGEDEIEKFQRIFGKLSGSNQCSIACVNQKTSEWVVLYQTYIESVVLDDRRCSFAVKFAVTNDYWMHKTERI
jgi:hypothetical protein